MNKAKIATLKEEIKSIHFADALYWKWKEHSNEASAEYRHRRDRLQGLCRELALWEKNAWPFAAERLSIR
jgi:hypothetical protein